jgi:hypothetical protein
MLRFALAASILAATSGAALASDVIPLRPALEDAEVLLYDGQQTVLGTIAINGGSNFSLGRDGAVYHFCNVGATPALVRVPNGSLTPELVVASNGTTTTGEEFRLIFGFVLLPSSGPIAILGEIREPGEEFYRVAILRIDAPDSVTVLLAQGDPAPPPLVGTISPQPVFRPLNLESDTHFAGRIHVSAGNGPVTRAIVRVSIDGDIEIIEAFPAFPSGSGESVDSTPAFGPGGDVTYLVASTTPRLVESELRRARPDGAIDVLASSGDPVDGPTPAAIRTLICRETVTENIGFDAYRAGPDGAIFVTSTLDTAVAPRSTTTALLRIDDDGARALLLDRHVDPSGATSIAPYLRPFEDGAFVATTGAREEVWFANDHGAHVVFDENTPIPGFAPGSTIRASSFVTRYVLGAARYDLARDRLIFRAEIDETPGASPPPTGLFSLASDGTIDLLMRNGDRVLLPDGEREVRRLPTLYEAFALADDASGQVLVSARFTDNSSAILRLQRVVSTDADTSSPCAGDLTRDNRVDAADLLAALNSSPVDFADLNLVLSAFGSTCD